MGKVKQQNIDNYPTPEQEKKLADALDTIIEGFGTHDTLKLISVFENMLAKNRSLDSKVINNTTKFEWQKINFDILFFTTY